MTNGSLENFSNEQNRKKYEVFSRRAAANLPVFKEILDGAENFMRADASIEDEFRNIIKRENVPIEKGDFDSLIRVSREKQGVHFIATLEGFYIDNGRAVLFSPLTAASIQGKEDSGMGVWLDPDEADGFRKRFPFDQLIKAYDEAVTTVQDKNTENILDARFGKNTSSK